MKKSLLALGLLSSLTAVSITAGFGMNSSQLGVLGSEPSTNAEYTIATWEYDGWCKNAGIYGYGEQGRVFMFHSSSNGAGQGARVRDDVKLAVILNQRDVQDDIVGDMIFTVINGMPSLVCGDDLSYPEYGDVPVWPAHYMAIYTVRIMIGDFTFEGDSESGVLTKNDNFNNFSLKSFIVNATLTYAAPSDDQPGNWYRTDHTYPRTFTQTQTEIGDYGGASAQPHIGIKIDSIIVTYGCSY